jgi:ubiquinone/menaquinone biosynthesis C-methylase UbiE
MAEPQIRFEDGVAYERSMGGWSRLAGEVFLDWLAPRAGLRWLDIGCGNGAFTEVLVDRVAPAEVQGIDRSEAQLAFARTRPAARTAQFRLGDAMAVPFDDRRFDAAAMALVIHFVPDPAKAVAEMARVVVPGGMVAAYVWDFAASGEPTDPVAAELRAMGFALARHPSLDASRMESLRQLWTGARLTAIETREITVERSFSDFEDCWTSLSLTPNVAPTITALNPSEVERLKAGVRGRLPGDDAGRITCAARANAITGRVPG